MESKEGYIVHEVNNTVEFKGAQAASKTKIAKKMMELRRQEREEVDGAGSGSWAPPDTPGGELLRLLLKHGKVDLAFATSRRNAGEYLFRVHPNLRGMTEMQFVGQRPLEDRGDGRPRASPRCRTASRMKFLISQLAAAGVKVVDLSADFRLKNAGGLRDSGTGSSTRTRSCSPGSSTPSRS